jgi:hypothetical protein
LFLIQKMYLALQLNRIVISTKGEICWAVVQGLSRSLLRRDDSDVEQIPRASE